MRNTILIYFFMGIFILSSSLVCQKKGNLRDNNNLPLEISIYYKSSPTPTPYNYSEHIIIKFNHNNSTMDVSYDYDRFSIGDVSDFEEEEYMLSNDWSSSSQFGDDWYEDFIEITGELSLYERDEIPGGDTYEVIVEFHTEKKINGRPEPNDEWELLREELTNAIMQKAGFQLPTPIKYVYISDDGKMEILTLDLDYVNRNGIGKLEINGNNRGEIELKLEDFRDIRSAIRGPNYKGDEMSEELPSTPGYYLQRGSNMWWVSFEEGMEDTGSNPNAVRKLKETFEEIKERLRTD